MASGLSHHSEEAWEAIGGPGPPGAEVGLVLQTYTRTHTLSHKTSIHVGAKKLSGTFFPLRKGQRGVRIHGIK